MHQLKWIKEQIANAVCAQLSCIEKVNTHELGEAIDALKDLEEAMYYCSKIKRGEKKVCEHCHKLLEEEEEKLEQELDKHEGRSYMSRCAYMKAKQEHKDKATKIKELDKYMQELTEDILEMIDDTCPEERQLLEKKITHLTSKIAQLNTNG